MKVGIITFFRPINNGAVLQACATNRIVLNKLGVSSELIDYRLPRIEYYRKSFNLKESFRRKGIFSKVKGIAGNILFFWGRTNEKKRFDQFIDKYLMISNSIYISFDELKQISQDYDAYVVGSDLVWNPLMAEGVNPIYFLEFEREKKKIAYAPSIGITNLEESQIKEIAMKAESLDWVSVREQATAAQLQKYMTKKVYTVLDPTLLTYEEDWNEFYSHEPLYKKKFIFAFTLETSDLFIKQVNALAEKYNYDVLVYGRRKGYHARGVKNIRFTSGPSEFLNYIKYAQIVVTNSFHGCAFSIIFHKDFYCIPHSTRGIRMTDIMHSLKINDRIIQKETAIRDEIDYISVENIRNDMINSSMDYLNRALMEKCYEQKDSMY